MSNKKSESTPRISAGTTGRSMNQVLESATMDYLSSLDPTNPPRPSVIETELLQAIQDEFDYENSVKAGRDKWKCPGTIPFPQLAEIIAHLYPVRRIPGAEDSADPDYDMLAIYQAEGPDRGTYVTSEDVFRGIARQYNNAITSHQFNELMLALRDKVERKPRCLDPDLIAVNNGIFNYATKQLQDFDPDLVFLSKSHVDYVPNPINPVIYNQDDGTDWDVETWMHSLSDDDDIVELLWQITGAIIRPNVRWDKGVWFYSETGNSGKGTLCSMMRNLCGPGNYATISMADFSKDFMLEQLIHASAVIADENDVGEFIDKAANLKAAITQDPLLIDRKHRRPISYVFRGLVVQCLNEYPKIRDTSGSFIRRQLFVPLDKCFTGVERRYIKSDYLARPEVLRYVLWKVLNMDYTEFSEPAACKAALEHSRLMNDPVRQFANEVMPELVWNLLPWGFLYDLYVSWFYSNNPSGRVQKRLVFKQELMDVLKNDSTYRFDTKDNAISVAPWHLLTCNEPLVSEYGLSNWFRLDSKSYRGILRVPSQTASSNPPASLSSP